MSSKATYSLDCVNQNLKNLIERFLQNQGLAPVVKSPNYYLVFLEPHLPISHLTQKITEYYFYAKDIPGTKLAVVIINNFQIDTEFVRRVQQLLSQLGGETPCHRLIVTQDIFTSEHLPPISEFEILISKALVSKTIQVSSKGSNNFYPTQIDALLTLVLKSIFLYQTSGKTYYFTATSVSDLNLAYLMESVFENNNQTFDINTTGINLQPSLPQIDKLSADTLIELNQLDLQDIDNISLLKHRIEYLLDNNHKKVIESEETNEEKTNTRNLKKLISISVFTTFTIIIFPILATLLLLFQSYKNTTNAIKTLETGDINQTTNYLHKANTYLEWGNPFYQLTNREFSWISPGTFQSIDNLLSLMVISQSITESASKIYLLSQNTFNSLIDTNTSDSSYDSILAIKSSLSNLSDDLSQAKIVLGKNSLPFNLSNQKYFQQIPDKIKVLQNQVVEGLSLIDYFLPVFQPTNQPFSLLIVIHDPNEIKASGGTISNLIAIKLEQQKITQLTPININTLNASISGIISPEKYISEISGSDQLSISNINSNPDFNITADKLTWFLEKNKYPKPQLVISLTDSLQEPYLQNIEEMIINYQNKNLAFLPLVKKIISSYNLGDIQAYFTNSQLESVISNKYISGIIKPANCHSQLPNQDQCLSETVYLNESNLTVNPINSFLTREVTHQVNLTPSNIEHTITLIYHYLSPIANLNRPYQSVYQIYLPEKSNLESITLDNQSASPLFTQKETSNHLDHYLFYIPTPLNQDHQLIFKFTTQYPDTTSLKSGFAYSLNLIKQPGSTSSYQLSIRYPSQFSLKAITDHATVTDSQVNLNLDPFTSQIFGLQL